jgi:hypothetical protein
MPDGFALAALSFALRFRVEQMIREYDVAVTGQFDMTARSPESLSASAPARAAIALYPYAFHPNSAWESSRPPAYSTAGLRQVDPLLALDVHYLLAGYAPDGGEVERVLGLALLAMHESARLTPEMLEEAANNGTFANGSPLPQALRDLAGQVAPIKVSPIKLELADASSLWSTFNAGVRSGMAYNVGTILIERRLRRAPAPPVREGRLGVVQIRRPTITRFIVSTDGNDPFTDRSIVLPGDTFRALGSGLASDVTQFRVSGRTLTVAPGAAMSNRVVGVFPADLRPGLTSFQILHRLAKPVGDLPPPAAGDVPGERSNLIPLAVRPVLGNPAVTLTNRRADDGIVSFSARVQFGVAVGSFQRGELLLTATTADADGHFASFVFVAPDPATGAPDTSTATRDFTISNVPAGNYLVRLVVDGAESELSIGAAGYDGPLLTVPA